jgi:hypothetical protein
MYACRRLSAASCNGMEMFPSKAEARKQTAATKLPSYAKWVFVFTLSPAS